MKASTVAFMVLVLAGCSLGRAVDPSPVDQLSTVLGVPLAQYATDAHIVGYQPDYRYTETKYYGKVSLSAAGYRQWLDDMDRRWTKACRNIDGFWSPEGFLIDERWKPYTTLSRPTWWTPSMMGVVVDWYTDTGGVLAKFDENESALYLMITADYHPDYCRLEKLETPVPKTR